MPRLTITSSCPSASTAITAVCEKTLPMLRLVKKTGVVRLTTTTRMRRISAGPARRATSARLQEPVVRGTRRRRKPGLRMLHGTGHLAHGSPASDSRSVAAQTGPSGNAYSSSDSGSISML